MLFVFTILLLACTCLGKDLSPNGNVSPSSFLVDQQLQNDAFATLQTTEANALIIGLANEGDDDLEIVKIRSVVTDSEGTHLFRAEKAFGGVLRVKSNQDVSVPLRIKFNKKRSAVATTNGRILVTVQLKDEEGKLYENVILDKRTIFVSQDEKLAMLLSNAGTLLSAAGVVGVFGMFLSLMLIGHETVAKMIEGALRIKKAE